MNPTEKAAKLIMHFESLHDGDLSLLGLQPKMCPAGIWTQGYGHAIFIDGEPLVGIQNKQVAFDEYTLKDEAEALRILEDDIRIRSMHLNDLGLRINQNQFDALISWIFNFSVSRLNGSTLFKMIKENPHNIAIYDEFLKWNKANVWDNASKSFVKKPLRGLTLRRKAEAELYFTGKLII